jgi:hypothetical protein
VINTLRGLMAEFGIVIAEGPHHVGELVAIVADPANQRIPTPLHDGLLAIVGRHHRRFADRPINRVAPRSDAMLVAVAAALTRT